MRLLLPLLLLAAPAAADLPTVEGAVATQGPGGWTFAVTVRHADEGWEHHADAWAILALDGTELGRRVLAHPHVDEQPFTRSGSGIAVPGGTTQVIVRAHDGVHGWGPDFVLDLP